MKLFIKNMRDIQCQDLVKQEIAKLGLHAITSEPGEVKIKETISPAKHDKLKNALEKSGLELMSDRKTMLAEKITAVIEELVEADQPLKINFLII